MKRYDCETEYQAGYMNEYDDGEYVRFEDVERLISKVNALRAALTEVGYGESNGMANGGIMCRAIARSILNDFPVEDDCQHNMIKPDDSAHIQWGDYGVCENCHEIRRM